MSVVIDAAALLAVLLDEPGAEIVLPVLRRARMSAVNVSESCSRGVERGSTIDAIMRVVRRFELTVVPFDVEDARLAAELRPATKRNGVSLGDRACMALAYRTRLEVLTADRRLAELDGVWDIRLRLIR